MYGCVFSFCIMFSKPVAEDRVTLAPTVVCTDSGQLSRQITPINFNSEVTAIRLGQAHASGLTCRTKSMDLFYGLIILQTGFARTFL